MAESKDVLNKFVKGAGITAFGIFFSKIITYFYRAVVARLLGSDAYGQLSIGIMLIGIIATLSGESFSNALEKFIPEYRENNDQRSIKGIVLSSIHLSLLSSLILGIGIFFSAEYIATSFFNDPNLTPIIQIFALIPIISRPYELLLDTTISFNKPKYKVIISNIFQNLVQLAATVLLIALGFNVIGAALGWAAGVIASTIIAFIVVEKKFGPLLTSKDKPIHQHKKVIMFTYPLMMSGILGTVLGWSDTALLGFFSETSKVGLYNAAFPTALLITIPHMAFTKMGVVSFSEMNQKKEDMGQNAKLVTNWIFALVFPAFLLMTFFSEEVLLILFGNEYTTAATALAILTFGNLIDTSIGTVGDILKSKGHTKPIFYNTVLAVILNLGLNIYLIPKLGIEGAAIATASTTIFTSILLFLEVYRYEKIITVHRNMLKSIFSGLISLTVVYLAIKTLFTVTPYWILFPAGLIFGALYLTTFAKIGGLTEHDKAIIKTLGRKIGHEEKAKKMLETLT